MRRRPVPEVRVRALNGLPARPRRAYVLYWSTSARRPRFNFALERAVERARELGKPLVVLEALRADEPFASDRLHRFVLDGMRDQRAWFARRGVAYHAYVEPERGAGRGLLRALAERACVVVADDHPGAFLARTVGAGAEQVDVLCEAVDGNGLLPIRAAGKAFARAYDLRRYLQRELPAHLAALPRADPLARAGLPAAPALPAAIRRRWPAASDALLAGRAGLEAFPIDHAVAPIARAGGPAAGARALADFVARRLAGYADRRGALGATSGLSAYLHFGHVGAHEVLHAVLRHEGAALADLGDARALRGSRRGFFGTGPGAEAFLDQLVTWRELGFNACAYQPGHALYATLPAWARATLAAHARDPRPVLYDRAMLESAATHDEVWNAAQRQLRAEGVIEGYLRMLWGKKVLEWTRTPEEAYALLFELNDRWAVDGRDPNTITSIRWIFGAFDRPWGPERPIFGTVRYMTSDGARRKLDLAPYLARRA